MKKFIVTFCIAFAQVVIAQPEKGKVLITGNLQLLTSFNDDYYYTAQAEAGYLIGARNALGISVGYNQTYGYQPFSGAYYKRNDLGLGIFDRKYFSIGKEGKFFFFLNSYYLYTKSSFSDTGYISEFHQVGISPGFSFFPARFIGIDLSLSGLNYSFNHGPFEGGTLTFGANLKSPSIGITILLGGKKADSGE